MLKVVLKLEVYDEKTKRKVLRTASDFEGLESISMDMKDKKLTLTGSIDPVKIVPKLRKFCHTEIFSVGPAKEPEKKKEEPKKDDAKKDDTKKDGDKKDDLPKFYYYHHPHYYPQPYQFYPASVPGYYYRPVEEYPNAGCSIC